MIYKSYSWRLPSLYKADAQLIGGELEQIENTTGLNAENVLEYAKNPKTELNKIFDWDDTSAANKYRLEQARHIIMNIQVEIIKKDEDKVPVRAFVKTTKKYDEDYKNIESVISDAKQYQLLLAKAYAELNGTKRRYSQLEEIQELLKDIPEVF